MIKYVQLQCFLHFCTCTLSNKTQEIWKKNPQKSHRKTKEDSGLDNRLQKRVWHYRLVFLRGVQNCVDIQFHTDGINTSGFFFLIYATLYSYLPYYLNMKLKKKKKYIFLVNRKSSEDGYWKYILLSWGTITSILISQESSWEACSMII